MRIYLYPLIWVCLGVFKPAFGQVKCDWKTWKDLGQAISENSPEINVLKNDQDYRQTLTDVAELSPPAVAAGQYTVGGAPWESSTLEATYLWTIEGRQKRESRLGAARSGVESLLSEIEDRKAQQLLKVALIQQHLKRIEARQEVLAETQATYKKIIRQYEGRLMLGPEQRAELAVFKIAKNENNLKMGELEVERSQQAYHLAAIAGCREIKIPEILPGKKVALEDSKADSVSTAVRRLEARAKSLQLAAQSEIQAFSPDFSIGPTVIAERDDDNNTLEFGVAASFPIGAQRVNVMSASKSAELRVRQSEVQMEISQIAIKREAWLNQYRQSIAAMKRGLSQKELSSAHKQIESLSGGERVSAALVIEAHRQLLEHISSYTDLESKATEAAWNILYLDGEIDWSDL